VKQAMRFLGAALVATVVVGVLMVSVLWGFGLFERPERGIEAHPVELLSRSDRLDVAALVGADRRQLPRPPPERPVEPLVIPPREVSGFVQLEVEVDEDGRVLRADVVNALPGGVYEEQALRQVRQRRYPPRPGTHVYTEVVPFRLAPGEAPGDDAALSPPAPRD
jgi:hypothetical protein